MPHNFDAIVFDLDGVITKTATVHSKAWKETFDAVLKRLDKGSDEFTDRDYKLYVDGRPRYDGVRGFLDSRGISLPFGEESDKSDALTVCGIGNRKNDVMVQVLSQGVEVFDSTVRLMRECRENGIKVGVASSSKNCKPVLEATNLLSLVEARVDGIVSAERKLTGKPAPDIFVECARDLGTIPARAIVFEDAISGVQAGRAGNFALVVGLAREDNINELIENGADVAFADWGDHTLQELDDWVVSKDWSSNPNPIETSTQNTLNPNAQAETPGEKALLKGADTGAAALQNVSVVESGEIHRSM